MNASAPISPGLESGELKERVDYDKLVTTAYAQKAAEK